MKERFGVEETEHELLKNLEAIGFVPNDIDIIVLSHLHFDHAGGLLKPYSADESLSLCFPNAKYVVSRDAWERANAPHARDRTSFIPELQPLLKQTGQLEIVDGAFSKTLGPDYPLHYSNGHTPTEETCLPKCPA